MAYPVVQSVTTTAFSSATTSHLVNMPATVGSGDLLLVMFGAANSAPGVVTPTGWTGISPNNAYVTIYAKAAAGTEGGTTVDFVTAASLKAAALCYRITGWSNSGTITNDVNRSALTSGTSTTPDSSAATPSWGAADTLWISTAGLNALTTVGTSPTSFGAADSLASGGSGASGTKVTVGAATLNSTIASVDPAAWGAWGASAAWNAWTIAVRPGTSGSPSTPAVDDTASRFRLGVRGYDDTAARFKLAIRGYKDIGARFELAVRGYKDIGARFTLTTSTATAAFKDIAARARLAVRGFKDIAARSTITVRGFKDIATRAILNARSYKDIVSRAALAARGFKDVAARAAIMVRGFKDVASRTRLTAQALKDVGARFALSVPASFKDVAARVTLTVRAVKDVGARFTTTVRAFVDVGARAHIIARAFTDVGARFRLIAAGTKDVAARLRIIERPTRLYLRALTDPNAPTAGKHSTALPVVAGTNNSGATYESLALRVVKGGAQATRAVGSDADGTHHDQYIARFTSDPLAPPTTTLTAQTWTVALALSEGNAVANSYLVLSVYLWRPSTSAVVGYVYDSDSALGVEWAATEDGIVATFAGAQVVGADGDVIVLEVWRHTAGQVG